MKGITHILFAATFFLCVIRILHISLAFTLLLPLCAVMLGSIFPDIDHPHSLISTGIPIFKAVSHFVKHRGIIHSLFASIAFWLAALFLCLSLSVTPWISVGFWCGYIMHLLADSMTKTGVKWLQPFSNQSLRGFIVTGGLREKGVFVLLLLISMCALAYPFI